MNILITGASRGIGFEVAGLLAQDPGNTVLAISRSEEGLKRLLSGRFPNLRIFPFDLQAGDLKPLLELARGLDGGIDALVNNAGSLINKPMDDLSADDFDRMFGVNVKSPFLLIQALLPYFNPGSHIVNIGSMGGFQGSVKFPGLSLYSASKGALAILTECLALELQERGISANCLALGSAQTEMLSRAFPGYQSPLTARRMAEFIADFTLNGHKWFNGKVLPVALSTP